jgi:GH24 family phage-related lysozyme (muramidase)
MSSKTLLSQFGQQPTRRVSFLDEFMRVGDRMYGKLNPGADRLSTFGRTGAGRVTPLDSIEYFGKISANKGANIDAEKFKETIRKAEGLRLEPYKDKDKYSIGYGHLLVDGPTGNISVDRIDKKDAEALLEKDVQVRLKEVNRLLPDFKNFPEDAQQAIFSEYYRGSIGQSPVTRKLINQGKYAEAAKEFLNNKEYIDADKNKMGGIKKRMEAVSNALMKMSEKQFLNDIVFPKRKPFSMGGAAPGRGTSVGRGGLGSGGNKGNKGDRRGVKSMRDSGMVSTSTGYGPAGAGGMAQGPSGNQGNQQGNQPDTTEDTTTVETFTPTYEKEDDDDTSLVKELKEKYTFDLFGETYVGYKSPESGFNVGVTGGLNSVGVGVGISFKKGGLLDRSSKK